MKILSKIITATCLTGALALGACATDDGYSRSHTSMSFGVSSSDGPRHHHHRGYRDRDRDGIPNRHDRDRDGDGTPNRFDDRPNNPYRD